MIFGEGVAISFFGQRPFGLRLRHGVLAKPGHLAVAVLIVEIDNFFERLDRSAWSQRAKISIQISFEFIEQHLKFRIVKLALRRNVGRIDYRRAAPLDDVETVVQKLVNGIVEAKTFSVYADARAAQSIQIERLGVINEKFAATRERGLVTRIDSGKRPEQNCGIRH